MDSKPKVKSQKANKNRPRKVSSKIPVPAFREVIQVKKRHFRDPRFDNLSGHFNKEVFEENYSFLNDIRRYEKEELEKELRNVGNDKKRQNEIVFLLQRNKNQEKSKQMEAKKKEEGLKQRKEVIEALKAGKKPYFPKQSEVKKQKLVETFQALKKSGKLEKYLEKKRKKIFSKDKKRFYK